MTKPFDSPHSTTEPLNELLSRLRSDLLPAISRDARELVVLASSLETDRVRNLPDNDPRWLSVRELAHRLAGSVGTLGWAQAGAAAVELEMLTAGRTRPRPEDWPRLWRFAVELVGLLDQSPR